MSGSTTCPVRSRTPNPRSSDAIVAAAGERFRQSRWSEHYDLGDVTALASEVVDRLPRTDQVHQLLAMLDEASRLER